MMAAAANSCPLYDTSATRLRHLRSDGTYHPLDAKACSDGEFVFLVRPVRLRANA